MYLVTITNPDGSTIIHAPDASSIKLKTGSGKIPVNAVPSFDFSMLPDNPGYGLMKPLVTRVRVVRTDLQRIKFDGRILRPVNDMADSGLITRSFTCEDVIAYLHDGLPGYTTLTGTWQEVITAALKAYNSLVEDWKQIQPGKISDGGNLSIKTSPEMDWYDTLYKLVVTDHSYEWRIRTGDDNVHYLDVASQIGEVKDAPRIELAYNLKSMSVEADATNVISRVYPLGAVKQTDSTSTTTTTDEVQERVNLGDIGKPLYIDSPDLIAEYGIQPGKQIFDTITDANELPAKATDYLKGERPVTTKFTASALDLSTIGLDVDEFEAYNSYPVFNPLQSIDEPLRVTEQDFDINSPQTAALSFGDRMKRQSDFALEALRGIKDIKPLSIRVGVVGAAAAKAQQTAAGMQKQVEALQQEADEAGLSSIKGQLESIDGQFTTLNQNLESLGTDIQSVKAGQMTESGETLETLEAEIKDIKEQLKELGGTTNGTN
jgi:flagellin-like hook-associated protein FlgL